MKINKSRGNMYPWVTHTWSPVVGCGHQCEYCYVRTYRKLDAVVTRAPGFMPALGRCRTIFVAHMADLFSWSAGDDIIEEVLEHCRNFPENTYVFQTKNPERVLKFVSKFPPESLIGCTIETDNQDILNKFSKAPPVSERATFMAQIGLPKFITIEPVIDFDPKGLADLIADAEPLFINIGADSKGHNLPEPSMEKIEKFLSILKDMKLGIEVREKTNLGRLKK